MWTWSVKSISRPPYGLVFLLLAVLVVCFETVFGSQEIRLNRVLRPNRLHGFRCSQEVESSQTSVRITFTIPSGVTKHYLKPDIEWKRQWNGRYLASRTLYFFVTPDFAVREIHCRIQVAYEFDRYIIEVYAVLGKPRISITSATLTVREGTSQQLSCNVVSATGLTLLLWFKDDRQLTSPGSWGTTANTHWVLPNVSLSDAGSYKCRASNEYGDTTSDSIAVTVEYSPKNVIVNPSSITTKLGSNFNATCTAEANPTATFEWLRGGVRFSTGSLLSVTPARAEHSTTFTCRASNAVGHADKSLTVVVQMPPTVTANRTLYEAIETQSVTLHCSFSSNLTLTSLRWLKGTTAIDLSAPGGKYSGGTIASPSLTIRNVVQADSGLYKCEASNDAGTGSSPDINIVIAQKPAAVVSSTKLAFREGTRSAINCTLSASPAGSTVTWYKDGAFLNTRGGGYEGGTLQQPSLTIVNPQGHHEGSYVCAVEVSGVKANSSVVTVEVQYPPKNIALRPSSVSVAEGGSFSVTCSANAKPPATFTWFRNGATFSTGVTLTVARAVSADKTSVYTCKAVNIYSDSQLDLRLNVTLAPFSNPGRTSSFEGNTSGSVTLQCGMSANPPATRIRWLKVGDSGTTIIPQGGTGGKYSGGTVDTPDLTIHRLATNDTGMYQCEVTNRAGTRTSPNTELIVAYAPVSVVITGADGNYSVGEPFTLLCQSDGYPLPNFSWFRPEYSNQRISKGHLLTHEATPLDDTEFRCVAYNYMGTGYAEKRVNILYRASAVRFNETLVTASLGQNVTLVCPAIGNPPLDPEGFTWKQDGSGLKGKTSRVLSFTLFATNLGNYSCTAKNDLGTSDPVNFRVVTTDNIEAPDDIDIAKRGRNALVLLVTTAAIITTAILLLQRSCACITGFRERREHREQKELLERGLAKLGEQTDIEMKHSLSPAGAVDTQALKLSAEEKEKKKEKKKKKEEGQT